MKCQKETWGRAVSDVRHKEQVLVAFWLLWRIIGRQRRVGVRELPPLLVSQMTDLNWEFGTVHGKLRATGMVHAFLPDDQVKRSSVL